VKTNNQQARSPSLIEASLYPTLTGSNLSIPKVMLKTARKRPIGEGQQIFSVRQQQIFLCESVATATNVFCAKA